MKEEDQFKTRRRKRITGKRMKLKFKKKKKDHNTER